MSWINILRDSKFSITTGDGQVFFPLWKPEGKEIQFNVSDFDFIDLEGTKVDRKKARGTTLSVNFWFQGLDCLELALTFEISSKDSRYWVVSHPYYGTLNCQPLKLSRSDEYYGTVAFSVDLWETITEDSPVKRESLKDNIFIKSAGIISTSPSIYVSNVAPISSDVEPISANVSKFSSLMTNLAQYKEVGSEAFSNFNQSKNRATSLIGNLVDSPFLAMSSITDLIATPSRFFIGAEDRLSLYKSIFSDLKASISQSSSKSQKSYFEAVGATIIASISQSLVTPQASDYTDRVEVNSAALVLQSVFNDYLGTLDSLEVDLNDPVNSYFPAGTLKNDLQSLVLETLQNLFDLAFNAKQERVIYTDKETNIFVLTHKYIGLDAEDINLEKFRVMNKIKNNLLFNIPKGTKITYLI